MQLDVLREFVCLAKTLNYHTAAKELHISQPTLSNHITSLEKELSFALVDRTHDVGLTPAGTLFLEWAAGVISSYDAMFEKCKAVSKQADLTFSVQIPQLIDRQMEIFIERIQRFRRDHPQATVRILPVRNKYVLDEIRDGYCDCALFVQQCSAPELGPEYEGLAIAPLAKDEAVAWIKSDSPLAYKSGLSMRDLAESTIPVHVNINAVMWEMALQNDFEAYGLKPNISYRYAASPEEFLLSQLHDDDVLVLPLGYLDSPLYKLRDDRVAVRFDPPVVTTQFIVYRDDKDKSALREFVGFIEEERGGSVS